MKKYFLIIMIIFLLPILSPPTLAYATNNEQLVKYEGNIEHVFTHCLLADPQLSFRKDNPMKNNYDIDCITKDEFKRTLVQLYNNNYILVNINEIFSINEDGVAQKNTLYLPKNKKPLIMSFDDVNYDHKKMNMGMIDKIILDQNGNLASYTSNKTPCINYDDEFILIVENFIKEHPDFSFNGARGMLCLTGYDGILGYRTQHKNPQYLAEVEKVKPIVQKLKSLGWVFGSHSFGHYHMKKLTPEQFKEETESWHNQVQSIVGQTNIYIYPYGEWEVFDSNKDKCEKHKVLEEYGFKLFCGVGGQPYFSYLPNSKSNKVLFMDRTPFDGNTFRSKHSILKRLINVYQVYDHNLRPTKMV